MTSLLDLDLIVLSLAVIVAQFSCWFCLIWLLVLLDLSAGFCWILILALVGLDSWCIGLLLVHCLIGSWSVGVTPSSFFGGDQLNNLHLVQICLVGSWLY